MSDDIKKSEPTVSEEVLRTGLKSEERNFTGFMIKNYRFTYLLVFAIALTGLFGLFSLPREANPEVKIPFAVVTTVLPGATPADMEELVTKEIEDEIKNLDGLRRYTSSSGQSVSSVFAEFEADADLQESYRKLREAVDRARPALPAEANEPVVAEINFSDIPIVTYSLVGDLSDRQLKALADILQDRFEGIRNVSKAPVLGGLKREFLVTADPAKLSAHGLSLSQLVAAIARANTSLPAGDIEIDGFDYGVRVAGRFQGVDDLAGAVVAAPGGAPVYLRDVARVEDGFKERETESRIGYPGESPSNTISISIYKRTGGNILDIVDESKELIAGLQADGTIPAGVRVEKTNDNSVFIREDLNRLGSSGLQTMVLIVLILLVAQSLRGAVITAMALPVAFLVTFAYMYFSGATLNSLALFSLVLSLGLMVDNAIVIIEGIGEYIIVHKRSPYEAAVLSVWNYKWPIISGTMTTVSAFLPLLLVSGILGEFLATLPKTITATLLSSLFVALVILPTFASRFIKVKNGGQHSHRDKRRHQAIERWKRGAAAWYDGLMRRTLASRKRRRLSVAAAWLFFLAAIALPFSGFMKIQMFPPTDFDYFVVGIELPPGTVLDKTREKTAEVEDIVSRLPELANYVTNIGTAVSLGIQDGSQTDGANLSSITVNLSDKDGRERTSYDIAESLRPAFAAVQGAKVSVQELAAGPPTGSPIEVRVYGPELTGLAAAADRIGAYFKSVPGVINVRDTLVETTGDFTYRVDPAKAAFYGLDAGSVAAGLRTALFGAKATLVPLDGEDIDVTVKLDSRRFNSVNDLGRIAIASPKGGEVPLGQVAEVRLEPSLLSISHRDGERSVVVRADIEKQTDLNQVLAGFADWREREGALPAGYKLEVGGEVEDIERSFRETFLSLIIGIILIAFILVLQFNSFRQPFIILFTLPLGLIGVMFGLNVLRLEFSFTAFIGIVALAGIVVNNAIVLIDRINKNIAYGKPFIDSIIEAGIARFQPIALTTLTTITGILPLVFADELWRGLGVALISGLLFGTVLTLYMVPVLYAGLCQKEKCGND